MEATETPESQIQQPVDDIAKVDDLNRQSFDRRNQEPRKSQAFAEEAVALAQKIGYRKGIADSKLHLGFSHAQLSDNEKAFSLLLDSLALYQELNDEAGIANAKYNMAVLQLRLGAFNLGIESLRSCLLIREKLNDRRGIAACYFQLTYINQHFNELEEAMQNAVKSAAIFEELGDINGQASALMTIGKVFIALKKLPQAKDALEQSLALRKTSGEKFGYFATLMHWTELHIELRDFDTARQLIDEGLEASGKEEMHFGVLRFMQMRIRLEMALGNLPAAKVQCDETLRFAGQYSFKSAQYEVLATLVDIYKQEGDYRKAFEYYEQFHKLKEEVINVQASTQLKSTQLINQIEFAQKEAELEKTKNVELQRAYSIIEDKNKEIIDSINYARRIQYALLAHEALLCENLPDLFVLFKPKDIVSGDFYWATKKGDSFYLAVCDSTGHGVPGAFMSLLNTSFLNEAINEKHIEHPNEILDYVRKRLIENISQDGAQDGMDGVLLRFQTVDNVLHVEYAAAHNAPLLVRKGAPLELSCDKMPIGMSETDAGFQLHTLTLQRGDMLYVFTDGYMDQFGGARGKKYMYKQFRDLLVSAAGLELEEQREALEKNFDGWKGELEQVDDVCVLGIQV